MFFGKNIKFVIFLFKKLQFQFKTWKNSIEIAVAYNASARSSSVFRKFLTGFFITFFSLLFIALLSVIVYQNRDKIVETFQTMKSKSNKTNVKKMVETEKDSAEKNHSLPLTEKKDGTDNVAIVDKKEIAVAAIESTLYEAPPEELIKPVVEKVTMKKPLDSTEYFIVVANKAYKSLYLLQKQGVRWKVVKEYDIATGAQKGKKFFAGDRKTPEGQYFIVGRKEYSELSRIYGPLAYVLNYPNKEDRLAGRTGTGIWIHGTDPDSIPVDTRGCLEMNNDDLKELSGILKRGLGTPVTIVNNQQLTDPSLAPDYLKCKNERASILEKYNSASRQFIVFVNRWKSAWETKNVMEYTTFYDTLQFNGQGLDWNGWRERKLRTFKIYDTISITITNVLVTDYSDQSAIVKFYQSYKTNLNTNEVAKKLSLSKLDDSWKIKSESTCLKQELLL